uniref:G protein-coupled receptor n=1 Tax=Panagrolaimus sp. JU765 TaxID=591449 RepID=A0AC34QQP1_9BILA
MEGKMKEWPTIRRFVGGTGCAVVHNTVSQPYPQLYNLSIVLLFGLTLPYIWYLVSIGRQNLQDEKKTISIEAYKVHHETFNCIIAQICIPIVCFMIPYLVIQILIFVGIENVFVLSHVMVILTSLHSAANTIIMLAFIPAYRHGIYHDILHIEMPSYFHSDQKRMYKAAERKLKEAKNSVKAKVGMA